MIRPLHRIIAGVLVFVLASGSNVFAQQTPQRIRGGSDFPSVAERMLSGSSGDLKLVRLSAPGVPGLAVANTETSSPLLTEFGRANETIVALAAKAWLGMTAQDMLGISENAELIESETSRIGNVWLSSFALSFGGIPVRERLLHLNIGALNGKVMMLRNNLPILEPNTLTPSISIDDVMRSVRENLGSAMKETQGANLVLVEHRETSRLLLCYEVVVGNATQDELWRMTYDAVTGELLEKKTLLHNGCFRENHLSPVIPNEAKRCEESREVGANPQGIPHFVQNDKTSFGMAFGGENPTAPLTAVGGRITASVKLKTPYDTPVIVGLPNTAVTVNGLTTYTDSLGYWSSAATVPDVLVKTSFTGKNHSITRMDAANSEISQTFTGGPINIEWNDSNSNETERSTYYSVSYAHNSIRTLDPVLSTLDENLLVRVNYNASCNAFYDPQSTSLTFFKESGSCANTGLISDVVYHEFGHRTNHARYSQAAGKNQNMTDGSLNEGFADIISNFLRDDSRIGINFYGNTTKTLRNSQNTNRFPDNLSPDIHINGMIIAGAFWDLKKTMGLKETEKLFHTMCYQRPDGPGGVDPASMEEAFANTLMATLITDDDDNNLANSTPNAVKIIEAFDKHNIGLTGFIDLFPKHIADQDSGAANYPLAVIANYTGAIGGIDPTTVTVHYKLQKEPSYRSVTLTHEHDSLYSGAIPKLPAGSIVNYYVSAGTTITSSNVKTEPLAVTPLVFLVGFTQKIKEDAETNTDWQIGISGDSAKSGQWVRGEPIGTFYSQLNKVFVQQDTDHTSTGTQCFITGNANTNTPAVDDVDGGVTTLMTPTYDLSKANDPIIRYWYYYSNETGAKPGQSQWIVKLSTNDGVSWKTIQQSTEATEGWKQYLYRIRDYASPTAAMKVEFLASDNIGSLVEAGVDDFEILDAPEASQIGVASDIPHGLSLSIASQPVMRSTSTNVRITLAQSLHVQVVLQDLLGNIVQLVGEGMYADGEHSMTFTPSQNLASGIYIIEMRTSLGVKRMKVAIL